MISESDFMAIYNPIVHENEGDYLLQTLEDAMAFANSRGFDVFHVWTIVDAGCDEDGNLYASPGAHLVNRLGYIVTEKPWETGLEDAIWFEDDFDADEDFAA